MGKNWGRLVFVEGEGEEEHVLNTWGLRCLPDTRHFRETFISQWRVPKRWGWKYKFGSYHTDVLQVLG